MSEIFNLEEELSFELAKEDLAGVKNILTIEEPIESGKEIDANQINDFIPKTEEPALTSTSNSLPMTGTNSLTILPKYPYSPLFLIEGTPFSDLLFDTAKNDLILARGGDDWIIAWRGGDDRIYGEEGNDFIYAGEGNDSAYGGSGNDRMYGSSGNDYMYGDSTYYYPYPYLLATTDSLTPASDSKSLIYPSPYPYPYPSNGNDYMDGGSGDDRMYGGGGNDRMYGRSGNDYMYGDSPYYYPYLFATTDSATPASDSKSLIYPYPYPYPQSGNDKMNGGSGNDYMDGGSGDDNINGGRGDDTIVGSNRRFYWYYLDTPIAVSNEPLEATSTPANNIDSLTGTLSSNTTIDAGVQSDSLSMAPDVVIDRPIFYYSDQDILTGGRGADDFVFYSAYDGVDTINDFNDLEGDQIHISRYYFGGELSYGELEEKQFTLGAAATDANHRLIYDQSQGSLFFDADGDGNIAQVQFAQLSGNPDLSHSDIFVI